MRSRSDLIKAVKALSRERSTADAFISIIGELNTGSDRTAAIVWGTIIDDRLRSMIEAQAPHMSPDELSGLFHDRGALSDFAAKVQIGYLMTLFGKKTKHDLGAIREIRNAFAIVWLVPAFGRERSPISAEYFTLRACGSKSKRSKIPALGSRWRANTTRASFGIEGTRSHLGCHNLDPCR